MLRGASILCLSSSLYLWKFRNVKFLLPIGVRVDLWLWLFSFSFRKFSLSGNCLKYTFGRSSFCHWHTFLLYRAYFFVFSFLSSAWSFFRNLQACTVRFVIVVYSMCHLFGGTYCWKPYSSNLIGFCGELYAHFFYSYLCFPLNENV